MASRSMMALALVLGLLMSLLPVAPLAAADSDGRWGRVELPAPRTLVELEPSEVDETGIPIDATFRLISRDGIPAQQLASQLLVEPAVEMSAEIDAAAGAVLLRPVEPLEPGAELRFSLTDDSGAHLGTWTFHVRTPVAVVETIPHHERTNVPTDTGIELTFDRDGVLDPETAFSIEPQVKGQFERRGRVLSFVPRKPLQEDTVYRVTLAAGVGTVDPGSHTTQDTVIQFATRQARRTKVRPPAVFNARVAEARTGEPPIVEVYVRGKATPRVTVDVFRIGSTAALESALADVRGSNEWPYRERVIDTADLQQLESQQGTLQSVDPWDRSRRALTLAAPLPVGSYVLVVPPRGGTGPGSQLLLQVTDLSAYAHISTTSSVFWVNDVRSGKPVPGARVSLVGGAELGLTDLKGLLQLDTPEPLAADQPTPLILVRSDDAAVYVPFVGSSWAAPNIESWGRELEAHDLAWSFLYTDRSGYRSTDTINVWGMFRDRDGGSVPAEVELRLSTDWDSYDPLARRPPSIASATVRPSANGVYSGSLSFEELPLGSYIVEVLHGDEPIGETWVDVAHIIKPAYRLDVSTNRRAFLAGENVRVSVAAAFFDGTSVPGTRITVGSNGQWRAATTNATGRAVARLKARPSQGGQQIAYQRIDARPQRSEEGQIDAGAAIVVLPSSRFLDARVTREGGEVRASGTVHEVDLERLEQQIAKDIHRELDPRGATVPGATVSARLVETEWVRRQTGTTYDFITKKIVPVYRYDPTRRRIPLPAAVTGPDGRFAFSAPATVDRSYEIVLTTQDPAGRTARLTRDAYRPSPEWQRSGPHLALVGTDEPVWRAVVAEGEEYTVELRQGEEPQPSGGPNRYLFLRSQAGLQEALVQRSPFHTFTFGICGCARGRDRGGALHRLGLRGGTARPAGEP